MELVGWEGEQSYVCSEYSKGLSPQPCGEPVSGGGGEVGAQPDRLGWRLVRKSMIQEQRWEDRPRWSSILMRMSGMSVLNSEL